MRILAAMGLCLIACGANAYTIEFGLNRNALAIRNIDVRAHIEGLSTLRPDDRVVIDGVEQEFINVEFRYGFIDDPEIAESLVFIDEQRSAFTIQEIIRDIFIDEITWSAGPEETDRYIIPYRTGATRRQDQPAAYR